MKNRYTKADLLFSLDENGTIEILMADGREFAFGPDVYRVLSRLDGETDPYSVCSHGRLTHKDVDDILEKAEDDDLVDSPFLWPKGSELKPFIHFHKTPTRRLVFRVWSWVLAFAFIPLAVIGAYLFCQYPSRGSNANVIFAILSLVVALAVHETGHALACLSCPGGRVQQAGVRLTMYCVPVLYTRNLFREAPSRLHLIQFWAAGIEMNLALFGILTVVGLFSSIANSYYFLIMAYANAFVAGVSLLIAPFTDGGRIVSLLLGSDDAYANAGQILKTKGAAQKLLRQNGGFVELLSCVILFAMQLVVFIGIITFLLMGVYHV